MERKEILNIPKKYEPQIAKASTTSSKPETREIPVKTTAPTLVEFQSKNSTVPEWRLQIQNAVRKRQEFDSLGGSSQAVAMTSGANALKLQPQMQTETEPKAAPETVTHANPTLNAALQRIAHSRRQFIVAEEIALAPVEVEETPTPQKNYPFRIAAKEGTILPDPKPATINQTIKPRNISTLKTEAKTFDTNKLPPLPDEVSATFNIHKTATDDLHKTVADEEVQKTELKLVEPEEEIEDIAPFAMRFN
ncbi:MAG TPA: hypothetical protein PKE69_26835, partial [Pyrinomonadaceae bacterium]|nr:hypothetical protein [Pyrinomonadaceae bacterium]